MDDMDTELAAAAASFGRYLEALTAAGFEREEAFALVRDHHASFSWFALVSKEPPSWIGSPLASNESSESIAPVLRLSKLPTPEQ